MSFPLFVRSIRQSIAEIDPKLIEAAKTLGANNLKILKTIIIGDGDQKNNLVNSGIYIINKKKLYNKIKWIVSAIH